MYLMNKTGATLSKIPHQTAVHQDSAHCSPHQTAVHPAHCSSHETAVHQDSAYYLRHQST